MTYFRAGLAGLAAWLSFNPLAQACSTDASYVPPSDFELVEMADAIVVATAVGGRKEGGDDQAHVRFRVESILKGDPPKTFDNDGYVLLDPNDKDEQEYDAGACGRIGFTRGHAYVVVLKKTPDGDGWTEADYLFSASSTKYAGPNDPWIKTIRDFLDIQKRLAPREQYDELKRLAERLGKLRKSTATEEKIDLIERHLGTRSEFKPTWYLVETYEQLDRGEALRWPWMRSNDWSEDQELPSVDQQKNSVLGFLVQRDHPDAAPFFESQLAKGKLSAAELGSAILFVAQSGDLRRAFDIIKTRAAPAVPIHSIWDAITLIYSSGQAMNGGQEWEKPEWKNDTYIAERWPEIAFGFNRYVEQILGREYGPTFDEELEALKPADFRDWPEWTLANAYYDDEVQNWAAAELKDEKLIADHAIALSEWDLSAFTPKPADPASLPMQVMVRSYSGPRAETLERAFCQGEVRRSLLISMLGAEADDRYDGELFKRILATPSLTAEERAKVALSLSELIGASHKRARLMGYKVNSGLGSWPDLLVVALSDGVPDAKPIVCAVR